MIIRIAYESNENMPTVFESLSTTYEAVIWEIYLGISFWVFGVPDFWSGGGDLDYAGESLLNLFPSGGGGWKSPDRHVL